MMVRPMVILRHAEDASFLWMQRERMLRSQQHKHVERMRADSRLEGHIDGLVFANAAGLACALEQFESAGRAGDLFAASVVAHALADDAALERLLALAEPSVASRRAMVAASAWQRLPHVRPRLDCWAAAADPRLRRLAVGGLAVHRAPDDGWVARALTDADMAVRRRGARVVGELGALQHVDTLHALLGDHLPVALAAALSLVRLGDGSSAVRAVLVRALRLEHPVADAAVRALVSAAPADAMDLALQPNSTTDPRLLGIAVAETRGDVAAVPALLSWMEDATLARRAGRAFATLTGVDLTSERLCEDPLSADDEDYRGARGLAEDTDAPLPSSWKALRWWQEHGKRFISGARYLDGVVVGRLGAPMCSADLKALQELVARGRPRHRSMAARILAEHVPTLPLIETRAPATRMHEKPGLRPWLDLVLPVDASSVESA